MSTDKIDERKSLGLLAHHHRKIEIAGKLAGEPPGVERIDDPHRPPVPILLPRRTRRAIARATGRPFVPVPFYLGQGRCGAWIVGIPRSWPAPAEAGFAKSGGEP